MDEWRQLFQDVSTRIGQLERVISTSSGIPIRENLLPEALIITPAETPILNRLPVIAGSGEAVEWKEITGFDLQGASSVFYAEGGAPQSATTQYTSRSATYKLMGRLYGVTGLARAAGASYEDVLIKERENAIIGVKQDIENAIINADGTGSSFEGLIAQITAGNGSYVQDIGGALALDDIGTALRSCWSDGYQINMILVNALQAQQINDLVLNAGTHSITVLRADQALVAGGGRVTHIIDPITGHAIELIPHRNMAAGTVIGVPERLPTPVPGKQGQTALWWDELLAMTEMEVGISADAMNYYLKTYATLIFPGRRGAFKLTGIA